MTDTQAKSAAKDIVKDVAKELERRKRRRRIGALLVWIAAIVAAALYLRCGSGWGTGGKGEGNGGKTTNTGSSTAVGSGSSVRRCQIKVDAAGVLVDGKRVTRDLAVAMCKDLGAAEVIVAGDAREGDWAALRGALTAEHIDILMHR